MSVLKDSRVSRLLPEFAALLLLLLALCARSLWMSQRHFVPIWDEVAYLGETRELKAVGGPLAQARCFWRGDCRQDNRNPLYETALAPFVDGGAGDFPRAKLLTLACALATVLVVYGFSRARWGPGIALGAAAVLCLSWVFAVQAQQVLADMLYAALYAASLLSLLVFEKHRGAWALSGALAGLAFLAKGSAHFLLLAPLALAVLRRKARAPLEPGLWLWVAAFALAASCVLVRNVRVFHDPFYNVNARGIWVERWAEVWSPLWKHDDWKGVGALQYLRSHSLAHIALRLVRGAWGALEQLRETFGPGPDAWRFQSGWVMLALAAVGWTASVAEGRPEEALVTLAPGGVLFLAYSWSNPTSISGPRFHLAAAATWAPAAALGLRRVWELWGPPLPAWARRPWAVPAAVGALALAALLPSASGLSRDPRTLYAIPPHWAATEDWLVAHPTPGGMMISDESFFSLFDRPGHDARKNFSFYLPDEAMRGAVETIKPDHILVDTRVASFAKYPERLGPADAHGPTSFMGWPRCYADPVEPSQFLVYCRPAPAKKR